MNIAMKQAYFSFFFIIFLPLHLSFLYCSEYFKNHTCFRIDKHILHDNNLVEKSTSKVNDNNKEDLDDDVWRIDGTEWDSKRISRWYWITFWRAIDVQRRANQMLKEWLENTVLGYLCLYNMSMVLQKYFWMKYRKKYECEKQVLFRWNIYTKTELTYNYRKRNTKLW
jgi:hypothetical protein